MGLQHSSDGKPVSQGKATVGPTNHRPRIPRRLPRWSELKPFLRTGPITLSPVERRLASAATVWDLRSVARRRVPRAVFDYVDGAAETETSLRRSREAY